MKSVLRPPVVNSRLRFALETLDLKSVTELLDALTVLKAEALAMERALLYYADPDHWFDGVVMLNDETNALTIPDNGLTAQWCLHLVDLAYAPGVNLHAEGAVVGGGDEGDGGDGALADKTTTRGVEAISVPTPLG